MRHLKAMCTVSIKYLQEPKPADIKHPHRNKSVTNRYKYDATFLASGVRTAIKAAKRWLKVTMKKWTDNPVCEQGCAEIASVELKLADISQYIDKNGAVEPMPNASGRVVYHAKVKGEEIEGFMRSSHE